MKKITTIGRAAGYLEKIYRLANERYFNGELGTVIITLKSTPRAYGHISIDNTWTVNGEGKRELNISTNTLDRPIEYTVATLLHEMCHEYNMIHGIKDTSRGYTYHNKNFKKTAEEIAHLHIEYHDKAGYSITAPTDETLKFCLDYDLEEFRICDNAISGYNFPVGGGNHTPIEIKGKTKKSSTRKYICPCCGQSVRATKKVSILCGKCSTQNEMVEMIEKIN